jgi:DNA-binding response OmpR family regulator
MKILLMEDDPVLGDIITDYLLQYYDIERVFDATEAQQKLDIKKYDF